MRHSIASGGADVDTVDAMTSRLSVHADTALATGRKSVLMAAADDKENASPQRSRKSTGSARTSCGAQRGVSPSGRASPAKPTSSPGKPRQQHSDPTVPVEGDSVRLSAGPTATQTRAQASSSSSPRKARSSATAPVTSTAPVAAKTSPRKAIGGAKGAATTAGKPATSAAATAAIVKKKATAGAVGTASKPKATRCSVTMRMVPMGGDRHEDVDRLSAMLTEGDAEGAAATTSPASAASATASRPSKFVAEPVAPAAPIAFDCVSAMSRVSFVREKLDEMLPEDVKSNQVRDDAVGDGAHKVLVPEVEQDPTAPVKVTVQLYRELFAYFNDFKAAGHTAGVQAVASCFDTILKLRIKRVHNSLLKTHLATLVDILELKHAGITAFVNGRKVIEVITLSEEVNQAVTHLGRVEGLVDFIVAPCDEETYAGVLHFVATLRGKTSQLVMDVISDVCEAIRQCPADAEEEYDRLWRALTEAFTLVMEHLPPNHHCLPSHKMHDNRVVGLVCQALNGKLRCTSTTPHRHMAHLLQMFSQDSACRTTMIQIARGFPNIWGFLVPALHNAVPCVGIEVAESMLELLQRDTCLVAKLFEFPTLFHDGLLTSAAGTMMVLTKLCEYSGVQGYAEFHEALLPFVVARLNPPPSTSVPHLCPLLKYIGGIVDYAAIEEEQADFFLTSMEELGVIDKIQTLLHHAEHRGARRGQVGSGGVLFGVCWEVINAFERRTTCTDDQQEFI